MRVGVFMTEANRTLLDLVVERLAREPDFAVIKLEPDPLRGGRPAFAEDCRVVVFASGDGVGSIDALCACVGLRCVELRDGGQAAVAWAVRAEDRPIGAVTPDRLVEAVREAVAAVRPT